MRNKECEKKSESEAWAQPVCDLQGTNTKNIDDLMKEVLFRCNSHCFTRLLLFFTEKTNIQKF